MRTTPLFFGLFSATALCGAVAACTSTTTTTTAGGDDAGTDGSSSSGGKDSGKDTGSSSGEDTGTSSSSGGTPEEKCAEEKTLQECGKCCVDLHTAGYKTFQDTIVACACKGTGAEDAGGTPPCATACGATLCKATPSQPDTACNKCLQETINTGGACQTEVQDKCTANADCVEQQKCVAPCQGKP